MKEQPQNKKPVFKEGALPDFGDEVLIFKNGQKKINDLSGFSRLEYFHKKTEEEKKKFLEGKARELTARTAAKAFKDYCIKYDLAVEEMGLALEYLKYEHQSLVKKALENTTISHL